MRYAKLSPIGMFNLFMLGWAVNATIFSSGGALWERLFLTALIVFNLYVIWDDGRAFKHGLFAQSRGAFWWKRIGPAPDCDCPICKHDPEDHNQ